jgi:hypothetical protein
MKNILKYILILTFVLGVGFTTKSVMAQGSPSVLYVPLIGITSVPNPATLGATGGNVTYSYAVKNFLQGAPLTDVQVVDDKCSPVKFVTGDDNKDSKLDFNETWRYTCTVKLSATTQSVATATALANNIQATHKAYATVVVGSDKPAPLVSIVNTTKVTYPESLQSLPAGGASVNFTYKVTNPGLVPLSDVAVSDDKCSDMSGKLGDINGNQLLDVDEVWNYSCTTLVKETSTDTATVTAFANGLKATADTSFTVKVDTSGAGTPPLFDVSISPLAGVNNEAIFIIWGILAGILTGLIVVFLLTRKRKIFNTTIGKR